MGNQRANLGQRGERAAARFLKKRGYRILARNYTCPVGELDIVALQNGVLTIAEVKTLSAEAGQPEERVDHRKRRKLARVASYLIKEKRLEHLPCQFDVLAVSCPPEGKPTIEHFPDAFQVAE